MLTKSDLSQIRKVVREETEVESNSLKSELTSEVKLMRMRLESRLETIENKLKDSDIKLGNVEKDLKYVKKTIEVMIKRFDEDDAALRKRVEKIEEHLNLSA